MVAWISFNPGLKISIFNVHGTSVLCSAETVTRGLMLRFHNRVKLTPGNLPLCINIITYGPSLCAKYKTVAREMKITGPICDFLRIFGCKLVIFSHKLIYLNKLKVIGKS